MGILIRGIVRSLLTNEVKRVCEAQNLCLTKTTPWKITSYLAGIIYKPTFQTANYGYYLQKSLQADSAATVE